MALSPEVDRSKGAMFLDLVDVASESDTEASGVEIRVAMLVGDDDIASDADRTAFQRLREIDEGVLSVFDTGRVMMGLCDAMRFRVSLDGLRAALK